MKDFQLVVPKYYENSMCLKKNAFRTTFLQFLSIKKYDSPLQEELFGIRLPAQPTLIFFLFLNHTSVILKLFLLCSQPG